MVRRESSFSVNQITPAASNAGSAQRERVRRACGFVQVSLWQGVLKLWSFYYRMTGPTTLSGRPELGARLEWMLALLACATALRPEEAFGLKWSDGDWRNGQITIRRGCSKGKETDGKNEGSMTQVAMHPALAQALREWRGESSYSKDADWSSLRHTRKARFHARQALPVRTTFVRLR